MDDLAAGSSEPEHEPVGAGDPHSTLSEEARARRRRHVRWIAPPLVFLVIMGYIGDGFLPRLVDEHPAWLVLLNPRNRNLALVTNDLDALSYYGLASFRLLLTDPIWFFIGREYGDQAIAWVAKRSRTYGELAANAESWFGKAAYPLIFFMPNNWVCLLSGAARIRPAIFVTLNVAGTVFRLYVIRVFGDVFSSPIEEVTDFIGRYQLPLMAVTIPLAFFFLFREFRSGEVETLTHLDEQMEHADDAAAEPGAED